MDESRDGGQAQTEAGTAVAFSPRKQSTPSSILFGPHEPVHEPPAAIPACFRDLNFDRIVSSMVTGALNEFDYLSWLYAVTRQLNDDAARAAEAIAAKHKYDTKKTTDGTWSWTASKLTIRSTD